MPLFREHPVRSTVTATVALAVGYFITRIISSLHAFHLTQTSVAMLAIASLMFLVTMHHRREGHLLTQTQEEMVLIGGFALFWIAALLAWRAMAYQGAMRGSAGELDIAGSTYPSASSRQGEPAYMRGVPPYPCASDDIYCVVEEWSLF